MDFIEIRNILIDGYYGFKNLGDEAVLRVILRDIAEVLPDARVSVLSKDPELTAHLHGVPTIDRFDFPKVTRVVESSDVVVIGGGGLFHEHYRLKLSDLMIYNYFTTTAILAKAFGKPLYYYGIGIGPFFTREGFSVGRFALSLADFVSVRDVYSLQLARALGKREVSMTADPAFLLEPGKMVNSHKGKDIFVSLREWVDKELEARLVKQVSEVIAAILSADRADRAVFVPFQTWDTPEHNDRNLYEGLRERLPGNLRERMVLMHVPDPQDMVDLFSKGLCVIGERLHSVILAAVAGIPFVALGYDRKVEYVCRDMGMSEFCLNIEGEFGRELLQRVATIEADETGIRDRIAEGRKVLKQRALLNRRYFAEFIQLSSSRRPLDGLNTPDLEQEILTDLRKKTEKQWDRIEALSGELAEKERRTSERERELSTLRQEIDGKNEQLARAQREIAEKTAGLSLLEEQRALLIAKEADTAYLQAVVDQRNSTIDRIYSSHGWRALLAYYRMRERLFPVGSRRGSLARGMFRRVLRTARFVTGTSRFPQAAPVSAGGVPLGQESETGPRGRDGFPLDGKVQGGTPAVRRLANLRAIAFYLPQFHPIPENDAWWGKGFTEWTNVSKAKPQFDGHYQPHVPDELGFYDLRVPEVRQAQATLAREHGIYGFCYYHYWFNGKLLLNQPLDEVLASGEPDFPFCLCWANEDWTRAWDGRSGEVLIGQHYSDDDDLEHIRYLSRVFSDRRYIRVDGKPLFLVYRANRMPDPSRTVENWRKEARRLGIGELYLCRVESFPDEHADPSAIGFDASVEFQPDWTQLGPRLALDIDHSVYRYGDIVDRMLKKAAVTYKRFPCVTPSWDNSPRRERDAVIFADSTPGLYEGWLRGAIRKLDSGTREENIVFINAWNEWGEGNHLEPDIKNGRSYLEATKRAISDCSLSPSSFKKVVFPRTDHPTVSIVIPVHNQWDHTHGCLTSILENNAGIDYEVIVADDHSTDETTSISDYVDNVKIVRNETNLGFLRNCNNAALSASGTYLVFLNNDTRVQKDWLKYLLDLASRDETIGLVGSKLVYPDGRLQEAGGIIWKDGTGCNYGRLDDPDKPEYNYVKEVDYVSGASILVRRDLWQEIGGFDENFSPAYYEDTDLAFEIRRRGRKVMFQPRSLVIHYEGASHGTDLTSGIKSFQTTNKKKFATKWKRSLSETHFDNNGQNVFHARDRSGERKTMLIVDNSVPDYDKHAGSRTIFQYLKLFAQMGFNLKFIDNNALEFGVKYEPYTSILEQIGVEVLYGEWYRSNWKKWIRDNGKYFDFVYFHKAYPSINYIDYITDNTKARIIYNCADFHYLREVRQYKVTKDSAYLKRARDLKKDEFYLFGKSDLVLTYSDYEKFILSKKMPRKKAAVTPIFFYEGPFPLGRQGSFEQRNGITFVGGFNHTPNIDAAVWFTREVFPRVLRELPGTTLNIVGSNPPEEVLRLKSDNVVITGFVSDERLEEYYASSRLVVAPIRFGAGVKGKIIEAIAHGIPVVSTTVGMEGIRDADGIAWVADKEDAFAEQVVELYRNPQQWNDMQRSQIEYAAKYLGFDHAREVFQAALKEL